MKEYLVRLRKVDLIWKGEHSFLFKCMADDRDHVVEQALNAYPEAELDAYEDEPTYPFMID